MQCTQKVKASAWTRLASFLSGGNQKNNISGFLSNVKSYFSDKTATDWVFEFFFLYVELGAAAVLGVLVYAIAAMVGVGLFVSYGLTAVACALGLYWGRSMTQSMKEGRAMNKVPAKEEKRLIELVANIRMEKEDSVVDRAIETTCNTWLEDRDNVANKVGVEKAFTALKSLIVEQEKEFSKLPAADQNGVKRKVDALFEDQTLIYGDHLVRLWQAGFHVSNIVQSLSEQGKRKAWGCLDILVKLEQKLITRKDIQEARQALDSFAKFMSTRVMNDRYFSPEESSAYFQKVQQLLEVNLTTVDKAPQFSERDVRDPLDICHARLDQLEAAVSSEDGVDEISRGDDKDSLLQAEENDKGDHKPEKTTAPLDKKESESPVMGQAGFFAPESSGEHHAKERSVSSDEDNDLKNDSRRQSLAPK